MNILSQSQIENKSKRQEANTPFVSTFYGSEPKPQHHSQLLSQASASGAVVRKLFHLCHHVSMRRIQPLLSPYCLPPDQCHMLITGSLILPCLLLKRESGRAALWHPSCCAEKLSPHDMLCSPLLSVLPCQRCSQPAHVAVARAFVLAVLSVQITLRNICVVLLLAFFRYLLKYQLMSEDYSDHLTPASY